MNLLSLDIGNTTMHFVVYDQNGSILYNNRVLTQHKVNIEESFHDYLEHIELDINAIVLNCVVPSIHKSIRRILQCFYACELLDISMESIGDMDSNLKRNEPIGADLLACAYGAYQIYKEAVIIVDMGSANKIIVVNDDFVYEGGVILPGVGISMKSFEQTLKHLPKIELEYPDFVLGRDTDSAIRSGFMYGVKYQIEAMVDEIEAELGIKAKRILTGGYGKYFKDNMPLFDYYPELIHYGNYHLYTRTNL